MLLTACSKCFSGLARVVLPELVDVDMKRLERFLHRAAPQFLALTGLSWYC